MRISWKAKKANLRKRLGSSSEYERHQALQELESMPPPDVSRQLKEFGKDRKALLIYGYIMAGIACVVLNFGLNLVFSIIADISNQAVGAASATKLLLFCPTSILSYVFAVGAARMFLIRRIDGRRMERALEGVQSAQNRGVIGMLLRGRKSGSDVCRMKAERPLIRLLRSVEAGDSILLTAKELFFLDTLIEDDNVELALAALKALSVIGDAQSIDACTSLVWKTQPGVQDIYRSRNPSLYEPAMETIAAIEQRLQRVEVQKTLLRPSSEAGSDDLLLRSAALHDAEDTSALLRQSQRL